MSPSGKETDGRRLRMKYFHTLMKVGRDEMEMTLSNKVFKMVGPVTGKAQPPSCTI